MNSIGRGPPRIVRASALSSACASGRIHAPRRRPSVLSVHAMSRVMSVDSHQPSIDERREFITVASRMASQPRRRERPHGCRRHGRRVASVSRTFACVDANGDVRCRPRDRKTLPVAPALRCDPGLRESRRPASVSSHRALEDTRIMVASSSASRASSAASSAAGSRCTAARAERCLPVVRREHAP